MLSVSTPRKRLLEDDGLERISSINISCPRGADVESTSTPPKKCRATAVSPAQIERPTFFPQGNSEYFSLRCLPFDSFAVDVSSLSCETSDMPALHRKSARMRLDSPAPSSTTLCGGVSQEKLYTNADVSKMVKEAVSNAVSHTKDVYEKILQEKLAGMKNCFCLFCFVFVSKVDSASRAEQYQQFVRFNEDYLSRAMKDGPHDYIS
jgi:hypothetical protein